jgi:DNA-directed RNA polymerase specialized sigma24 family protein
MTSKLRMADVLKKKDMNDLHNRARHLELPLIAEREDIMSIVCERACQISAQDKKPSTINLMARQAKWRLLRDNHRQKRSSDTLSIDSAQASTEKESFHQIDSMIVHPIAETVIFLKEVLNTLSLLPESWQQIMKLSALGFTSLEISKKLDIGLGTVERRISESRRILNSPEKLL